MQKLFNFLMVGLTFAVLNVATVAADVPLMDTSAAPIDINGWYLTDKPSNPTKCMVPSSFIVPNLR